MRALVALVVALALASSAGAHPIEDAVGYLETRRTHEGGFAEPGRAPTVGLTAWGVIALRAAGVPPNELERSRRYLALAEPADATDLELVLVARAALGERPRELVERVLRLQRPNGAIGSYVNSTIWGVIALRAADAPVPSATVRYLRRQQHASGGWGWSDGVAPDSNDTAAAVQALRAVGLSGRPIRRAVAFLRRHQNPDGGFAITRGRPSDSMSTAWAIQAFVAARTQVPRSALRYLERMRRSNGSYRYSARYAITPAWVTAQVVPALARKPLPLR